MSDHSDRSYLDHPAAATTDPTKAPTLGDKTQSAEESANKNAGKGMAANMLGLDNELSSQIQSSRNLLLGW